MLGDLELPNRVVMAPLTPMRMPNANGVPNDLMRDYYMQRASAGLIITEGTFVSDQARGWFRAPGVYTEEQREGWQAITDGVHHAALGSSCSEEACGLFSELFKKLEVRAVPRIGVEDQPGIR
jgi:2,4-dienoyl-CoA reductase-like NADH-dependent reductase (Old Yellow Enzyme family)